MKQYYQCRLEREQSPDTITVRTGWVEERGAKKGAKVELLPSKVLWTVAEVFADHAVPEDLLKRHQWLNRASLPSVERTQ